MGQANATGRQFVYTYSSLAIDKASQQMLLTMSITVITTSSCSLMTERLWQIKFIHSTLTLLSTHMRFVSEYLNGIVYTHVWFGAVGLDEGV